MFTDKELGSSEQSAWELRFNIEYYTAYFNLPTLHMLSLPARAVGHMMLKQEPLCDLE